MRIVYTSPRRPAAPVCPRHSVGWFRFTFLSLTLCMYFTYADINSTHRARSPAAPARRGATRLTIIYRHTTRAPACHPPPPVPRSSSLFISHMLSQHETRARTRTILDCPSSARTGATPPAAPVASRCAPPCRARAILALCRCACYVCPHTSRSTALHSAPTPPRTARPHVLQATFSSPFPAPLPRRPWITQPVRCGLAEFQQVRIPHTDHHRPAALVYSRHFMGWFRFTFLALTLCMHFAYADTFPVQRARSRVPPARRGAAPSGTIMSPSACAPACHPSSPVPGSSSLFISNVLYLRETCTRTRAVPGCPSSAHTGATTPAAPVASRIAPPCRGRAHS